MKKFMLMAACLGFMATASFAQNGTQGGATKNAKATTYYCPKCHASADKAGNCAHCKVGMVKDGDYYCPGCSMSSSKPGKCTHCNKDMVKMTSKKA